MHNTPNSEQFFPFEDMDEAWTVFCAEAEGFMKMTLKTAPPIIEKQWNALVTRKELASRIFYIMNVCGDSNEEQEGIFDAELALLFARPDSPEEGRAAINELNRVGFLERFSADDDKPPPQQGGDISPNDRYDLDI
jgi:hypothetical protein